MSENNNKKIACIFEDEKVFLTKSGAFYGYENVDGVIKCHRLNSLEIKRFLYRIQDSRDFLLTAQKVKKPLPRKYEDVSALEI